MKNKCKTLTTKQSQNTTIRSSETFGKGNFSNVNTKYYKAHTKYNKRPTEVPEVTIYDYLMQTLTENK